MVRHIFKTLTLFLMANLVGGQASPATAQTVILDDEGLFGMSLQMCTQMGGFITKNTTSGLKEEIEGTILWYGGISADDPKKMLKMAEFWNANSHGFYCPATGGTFPTQHLYERILEMGLQDEVINKFLLSDETDFPIDTNVVWIDPRLNVRSGEGAFSPITLVDLIDHILARPDVGEWFNAGALAHTRDLAIDFYGASRAEGLKPEDLAARSAKAESVYSLYFDPASNAVRLPDLLEEQADCTGPEFAPLRTRADEVYREFASKPRDGVVGTERLANECFHHSLFGAVLRGNFARQYDEEYARAQSERYRDGVATRWGFVIWHSRAAGEPRTHFYHF